MAVSLSISTVAASLPIAWRLYLPEVWSEDKKAEEATGVPPEIRFQTKLEIALEQIRTAVDRELPKAPVLADAAYGVLSCHPWPCMSLNLRFCADSLASALTIFQ